MAVQISKPPDAGPKNLKQLVTMVSEGLVKIPRFQRGFVWKRRNVVELLESILQGYPVGSLLFWLSETKLQRERDIEGFSLPNTPDKYPTNYVLDGQQRLTTVYGAVKFAGDLEKPQLFNVRYDLRKKLVGHREPNEPIWSMPLNIVFETTAFVGFVTSLQGQPDYKEIAKEAERVVDAFTNYVLPVVVVTDRTLKQVAPIFVRINSTGRKLRVYDLTVAATFEDGFDLKDEVKRIVDALKPRFKISHDGILRAVSAVRGTAVAKDDILALVDVPKEELRENITSAKLALERSVDFLSSEVGVKISGFLPYEAQLIVLTRAFHRINGPASEAQRKQLRTWFWLSSFQERYRGVSTNRLDGDVANCQQLADAAGPILTESKKIDVTDITRREFRSASAMSKALVALLIKCEPKSLFNGAPVAVDALSWDNKKNFHHIFPQAYLAKRPVEEKERTQDLANIMLLPAGPNNDIGHEPPSAYMKRLRDELTPDRFDEILASNLIPKLEDSGLLIDDLEFFLHERTLLLEKKINELAPL